MTPCYVILTFTVDSPLTDTSLKRTPRVCPVSLYSLYLNLSDGHLLHFSAGPKGVRLKEITVHTMKPQNRIQKQ